MAGGRISRKNKGKGKERTNDPPPPPPPPPTNVEVFQLNTATITPEIAQAMLPGTYCTLLEDIRLGATSRSTDSKEGKPVLPHSGEYFVVRVTNTRGQKVCYLFQWGTLYNVAFYVESEVEADCCWYIYDDYKHITLPPADQFPHVPVRGQGICILPIGSNYAGIGDKMIRLGLDAIDSYVTQLFTIRNKMTRSGKKLQKLDLDIKKHDSLRKGPLSFAAVGIAEPSRFELYKQFMRCNIYKEGAVPVLFTQFFTSWSSLSTAVRDRKGFVFAMPGSRGTILLTVEEVREMLCLLCSSVNSV